jgi:regulator of sirC expression with transglutaminase-like and TPR domain
LSCKAHDLPSKFQKLPFRLSVQDIAAVVKAHRPRCTHYDAIRFFPKEAADLNTVQPLPTRELSPMYEQHGCIHVNMDLLK